MAIRIELDEQLETILFEDMNATYCQRRDEARYNADTGEKEVAEYLGTYFPRSWAEHNLIWEKLMQSDVISAAFKDKPVITILDIGSGTGGHLFAVIECLKRCCKRSRINFLAIDANDLALEKQAYIYKKLVFNSVTPLFHPEKFELCAKEFENQLTAICKKQDEKFDIILTSKFLSEICSYAEKQQKDCAGFFKAFLTVADKFLAENGIISLVDVNVCANGMHIAEYMREEINEVMENNSDLAIIMPSHCGKYHNNCVNNSNCYMTIPIEILHHIQPRKDTTKICFRVFAHNNFANKILQKSNCTPIMIPVNNNGCCVEGTNEKSSSHFDYFDCFR